MLIFGGKRFPSEEMANAESWNESCAGSGGEKQKGRHGAYELSEGGHGSIWSLSAEEEARTWIILQAIVRTSAVFSEWNGKSLEDFV